MAATEIHLLAIAGMIIQLSSAWMNMELADVQGRRISSGMCKWLAASFLSLRLKGVHQQLATRWTPSWKVSRLGERSGEMELKAKKIALAGQLTEKKAAQCRPETAGLHHSLCLSGLFFLLSAQQ